MQCNLIGRASLAPSLPFLQPPGYLHILCAGSMYYLQFLENTRVSNAPRPLHIHPFARNIVPSFPFINPSHFLRLDVTTMCCVNPALHHAHQAELATALSVPPCTLSL